MRIAALYDIHGNLPALEAVLTDIEDIGIDHIIIGGDVVPGPMPRHTLDLLLNLTTPVQFLHGNGEVAVLEEMAGKKPAGVPEQYHPVLQWTAKQLEERHAKSISSWPSTLRMKTDQWGEILFCHATPRNATEIFTRLTSEERLLETAFANVTAAIVICGHTHMQFERMVGSIRVVNAGSVGMPFGEPGAYWLLISHDIELRRTPYNLAQAAELIRQTNYPEAHEFAAKNILEPPNEKEMLEVFARAELK
jgi:putative phosphoesterase